MPTCVAAIACLLLAYAAVARDVTRVPLADPLPNPYKGIAPYADTFYPNPAVPQSLFYDDVTWRRLEPGAPGAFDWDALEDDWAPHLAIGRRVGFRFKIADPWSGDAVDVPSWLVDQGVTLRDYEIDGGTGKAPDWDDATFLEEHDRVLAALGERYNGDPRVAWVDVGTYGIWGEWHVYRNPHLAGSEATKQRILDAYLRAFPDTRLVIPFDDDFATAYMAERGHGIRNDCLGPLDANDWYTESLDRVSTQIIPEQYKQAIIGGEFCGGTGGVLDSMAKRFDETLAFVQATHWSFVGPAGAVLLRAEGELLTKARSLHKSLGYRFRVATVQYTSPVAAGEELAVSAVVVNEGSAPFYHPWEVVVGLVDDAGETVFEVAPDAPTWDPRNWTPGAHALATVVRLPDAVVLASGEYTLTLSIRNPDSGEAPLFLAMEGRDDRGRYRIGPVGIAAAAPWDVNDDGRVDIIDLVTVASAFGATGEDLPADANDDGRVTIVDLVTVAAHFGETTARFAAAPRLPVAAQRDLVEGWLRLARRADDDTRSFRRGVDVLQGLLQASTPHETRLLPNYPNPFNPETWM
ncbi:DUF4832 domain-containing protein, partial [Candidatus Poribacteria bacterium]|nr:DUF4832 domain-containing protein [Candidatus Poribacteria bacterium]